MKFEIEAEVLASAMQRIMVAINRKVTIPLLLNVLVTAEKRGVRFTGTDNFLGGGLTVPAKVSEEGSVAIDAARLLTLAQALPKKPAILTEKENAVELRCGKSRYNLLKLPAEDFPSLPRMPKGTPRRELTTSVTLEAIKWIEHGMGTDESRAHLCGITMKVRADGHAEFVATDGHKLIKSTAKYEAGPEMSLFIPARAVAALRKLCEQGDETFHLGVSATHLFLWTGATGYNAKMLEGDLLKYEALFPTAKPSTKATIPRSEFVAALKRILTMDDSEILLFLDSKRITLSARNVAAGDGVEEVAGEVTGSPIEVGLFGRDLANTVAQFSGEQVGIFAWGEKKPILVTPTDLDETHTVTGVMMPLVSGRD